MKQIIWTEYFIYKAKLRGFDLTNVEEILRYSTERYYDTATDRFVVVGKEANVIVIIPHEKDDENTITPITMLLADSKSITE